MRVAPVNPSTASLAGKNDAAAHNGGGFSNAAVASPAFSRPDPVGAAPGSSRDGLGDVNERIRALNFATPASQAQPTSLSSTTAQPSSELCVRVNQLYCVYVVQPGDSLSDIAHLFGLRSTTEISGAELLAQSNRPNVIDTDDIAPGQKLRIPAASGVIHTVITAESLSLIAEEYGVSPATIQAVNNIGDSASLGAGTELLIPSPARLPRTAVPTALVSPSASLEAAATATRTQEPTATPPARQEELSVDATATLTPETSPTPRPTRTPRPTSTPEGVATAIAKVESVAAATATARTPRTNPAGPGFVWPAAGPISSYFGPAHPLGIDIDFYANPNQSVTAVAAGTVTFAGGDACCSYGLYVIVDHGNGFTTLYAHLSKITVTIGQAVSQSKQLGLGGRTGYATGNHLHFEVHLNGRVVNPLAYLP